MMDTRNSRDLVRETVARLGTRGLQSHEAEGLLQDLRAALLAFGSETEDNRHAVECLELVVRRTTRVVGVRGAEAALVDIVNAMEDLPVPDEMRIRFPGLDQTAWEASLRVMTLILLAFTPEG
jgi:hypothetical protein